MLVSESQSSLGGGVKSESAPTSLVSSSSNVQMSTKGWNYQLLLVWFIHYTACIIVLYMGAKANSEKRKYIPVDTEKLGDQKCVKAFVDVFSSSISESGALICCGDENFRPTTFWGSSICHAPPSYFLFARRLARFPDAWLLPLFPLLIRWIWYIFNSDRNLRSSPANRSSAFETSATTNRNSFMLTHAKRRMYLYLGLIQLRGWILYLAFDEIEDWFVAETSTSQPCWYETYLYKGSSPEQAPTMCQGRIMDFSDHVVLYMAQILPIALFEILFSFARPYWQLCQDSSSRKRRATLTSMAATNSANSLKSLLTMETIHKHWVPTTLIAWGLNLYIVVFLGAYKTAAYFHTPSEVFVGFLVSLFIQVPLTILQCKNGLSSKVQYYFLNQ